MRVLLILTIGLFFQTIITAQTDSREVEREIEKMRQEMQAHLKDFDIKGFNFSFDTLMFKNFQFPEGFDAQNFIMPDDIDMNEMMKMMERQFSQLDLEGMLKMMEENMDMSEMEDLFAPFMEGNGFIIPAPEELEKEENGKYPAPKKKKKTYKM